MEWLVIIKFPLACRLYFIPNYFWGRWDGKNAFFLLCFTFRSWSPQSFIHLLFRAIHLSGGQVHVQMSLRDRRHVDLPSSAWRSLDKRVLLFAGSDENYCHLCLFALRLQTGRNASGGKKSWSQVSDWMTDIDTATPAEKTQGIHFVTDNKSKETRKRGNNAMSHDRC